MSKFSITLDAYQIWAEVLRGRISYEVQASDEEGAIAEFKARVEAGDFDAFDYFKANHATATAFPDLVECDFDLTTVRVAASEVSR